MQLTSIPPAGGPFITLVAAQASTTNSASITGLEAGDFCVFFGTRFNDSNGISSPSGWTDLGLMDTGGGRTRLATKVATGSTESVSSHPGAEAVTMCAYRLTGEGSIGVGSTYAYLDNGATSNAVTYPDVNVAWSGSVRLWVRHLGHASATNLLTNIPVGWTATTASATKMVLMHSEQVSMGTDDYAVGGNTQSVNASGVWSSVTVGLAVV